MRLKQILSGIGSVILTGMLWGLQMIPDPYDEHFTNKTFVFNDDIIKFVWDNKFVIGLIILILAIILIVINCIVWYDEPRKKWLKEYMRHILRAEFAGNFGNTRITVFKVQNGISLWFSYILKVLILNFRPHLRCGILGIHLSNTPSWGKKHLKIYSRCSNPNEKGSSTFFTVPNNNKDVFGIAAKCCFDKKQMIRETNNISGIDITNLKFEDCNNSDMKKINKYAKDNYMLGSDKTLKKDVYNKMRCIHRLSNKHYVHPIFTQDDKIWGVFVIDIDSVDVNKIFTQDKCNKMADVVKAISLSLNYIK